MICIITLPMDSLSPSRNLVPIHKIPSPILPPKLPLPKILPPKVVQPITPKVVTTPQGSLLMYQARALDDSLASELYQRLLAMAPWKRTDEIRSRRTGFTRKARKLAVGEPLFMELIPYVESVLGVLDRPYIILGLYLNWYENSQSYTPSHNHDTDQLVISLGATRVLRVGSRDFSMEHGDAVLFGTQPHSVPRGGPPSLRFPEG